MLGIPLHGNPVQKHIGDSSCGDSGTHWYLLTSIGTRWHALLSRKLCPIRVMPNRVPTSIGLVNHMDHCVPGCGNT